MRLRVRKRKTHGATVLPAFALAGFGWATTGEPGHGGGLLVIALCAVICWPLLLGLTVFSLPGLLPGLVPREWRKAYRKGRPRPSIPAWLRRAVYAADRYKCAYCGSGLDLQVDHLCPWSAGGLSTLWNLVTLCGPCNRVKSNYWYGPKYYRPFPGRSNVAVAAAILSRERVVRLNPLRWVLAALSIA